MTLYNHILHYVETLCTTKILFESAYHKSTRFIVLNSSWKTCWFQLTIFSSLVLCENELIKNQFSLIAHSINILIFSLKKLLKITFNKNYFINTKRIRVLISFNIKRKRDFFEFFMFLNDLWQVRSENRRKNIAYGESGFHIVP